MLEIRVRQTGLRAGCARCLSLLAAVRGAAERSVVVAEQEVLGELEGMDDIEDVDDIDADGDGPSAEALAELAAIAESERAVDIEVASELAEARRALEEQRALTAAAVARYREAMLRAEPDLPAELVSGESIDAVDASLAAARRTVAAIRARLAAEAEPPRGFPAGSPARGDVGSEGLSAAEKIAFGLQVRGRD